MAEAFQFVRIIASVALLIEAAEFLAQPRVFARGGVFSWHVLRTRFPEPRMPALSSAQDFLFESRGVQALWITRGTCAMWLLVPHLTARLYFPALLLALIAGCLFNYRTGLGGDGSGQMNTILIAGMASYCLLDGSRWQSLGLWFVALEGCLAYFASGISKLASPVWRGGATATVLNTLTYGNARIAGMLRTSPKLDRAASWSIILFECIFPLSLIAPYKIAIALLVAGCLFHLLNAVLMGLNVFFWSYVATYPAILFCNSVIRSSWSTSTL
jgi:hypothetical protein